MEFKNQVVVITGSTKGIGKETAIKFASKGAVVVINSKNSIREGLDLVESLRRDGNEAMYIQGDMSDEIEVKRLFQQVIDKYKHIDILVNNAGLLIAKPFLKTDKKHWLEVINNNILPTVLCSLEVTPIMDKFGKGRIINISSIRGLNNCGGKELMAYSASKSAIISFTQTLAKDLAPNILVNAIVPGFVKTPRYEKYDQESINDFENSTYLGRLISPDEIADAILFVANSNAITGQSIIVDCGYSLHPLP